MKGEKEIMISIAVTLLSSLLSGAVATLITVKYYKNQEKRQRKLDLLASIMRNINSLTPGEPDNAVRELTGYLNEAYIVFNDSEEVLQLLDSFKEGGKNEAFKKVIKSMCRDLKIDYSKINDEFITNPFTSSSCKKENDEREEVINRIDQ